MTIFSVRPVLLQWANLHIFHYVFAALHQNDPFKWRMLTHHSTYPIHAYNKLRKWGLSDYPNFTVMENWSTCNIVLPALTCHTSGLHRSFHVLHHVASTGPCWCHWVAGRWAHPDTPHRCSSQSVPESPCWSDLDRWKKETHVLDLLFLKKTPFFLFD